jgi:hypothetical protein
MGEAQAQSLLGGAYAEGIVPGGDEQAVVWYRKAAEQGDASAQVKMGMYLFTGKGVAKDLQAAGAWWRKAAEQGDASGQASLGLCYGYGLGMTKDPVLAASWWRKAAEQGEASAQGWLAGAYQRGEGVPKDLVEAYTLRLMVGPRDAKAARALSDLEASLSPADLAAARARAEDYRKAIAARLARQAHEQRLR